MIKHFSKSFITLYFKIIAGIVVAIILNIFLTFSMTDNLFRNYFQKQVKEEVFSTLTSLSPGISNLLEKGDSTSIQRLIERVGAYTFVDVVCISDLNGIVLFSNKKEEIGKKVENEIVKRIIVENRLQEVDSDLKEKKFEAAVPIRGTRYNGVHRNNIIGVIFLKTNIKSYEGVLLKYRDIFIKKYLISGAALMLLLFFLLVHKLLLPVSKLFDAVGEVSNGDYKHEIMHRSNDEFSYLIEEFNYMIKQINIRDLEVKRIKEKLKTHNSFLEKEVNKRTKKLKLTQDVTIRSLASLAETRDNETGMHIHRTKNYVKVLAEALREHPKLARHLNKKNIELIVNSAPLHDIGKVGIPDSILMKKGKLTRDEFEEMKKHTIYGRDSILKTEETMGTNSFLRFAKEIAYSHHEKWDGSGYPEGLIGEEIPISARLMAIADVYDALISRRHYKDALPHEEAVRIITEGDERTSPEHFDPDILKVFKRLHHKFREIYLEFSQDGR